MVRKVVDLPAPLAPIESNDLPFVDGKGDSLKRVNGAVIDVQILHIK